MALRGPRFVKMFQKVHDMVVVKTNRKTIPHFILEKGKRIAIYRRKNEELRVNFYHQIDSEV